MPFRLDEFRAKIQFITSARMPHLIYKACVKTECVSNTRYIQEAVCERLAKDLNLPLESLLSELPPPRGHAKSVFDRADGTILAGPANTIEEVRQV